MEGRTSLPQIAAAKRNGRARQKRMIQVTDEGRFIEGSRKRAVSNQSALSYRI
jgi:hypothetical protein